MSSLYLTYKELKHSVTYRWLSPVLTARLYLTYKELKQRLCQEICLQEKQSLYLTYKELKHATRYGGNVDQYRRFVSYL